MTGDPSRPESAAEGDPVEVEVRVHGVGGATPDALLNVDTMNRIAGDDAAGFYRVDGRGDDGAEPREEAYSWGALTRSGWVRAFWVLLLPFALTNAAGWMAISPTKDKPAWGQEGLIRAFGAGMTAISAVWLGMLVNLTIFSGCGLKPECEASGWLAFLDWLGLENHAARVVAVALVGVPMLWVAGLMTVAAVSRLHRRAVLYDDDIEESAPLADASFSRLQNDCFWRRSRFDSRLAQVHATAALCASYVIAGTTLWRINELAERENDIFSWLGPAAAAVGLVGLTAAVGWAARGRPFHRARRSRDQASDSPPVEVARGILALAATAGIALAVTSWVVPVGVSETATAVDSRLLRFLLTVFRDGEVTSTADEVTVAAEQPGLWLTLFFVLLPLVLVMGAGAVSFLRRDSQPHGPVRRWLGPGPVLLLAVVVLVTFSAGLAAMLERFVVLAQSEGAEGPVRLGEHYAFLSAAFVLAIAAALVVYGASMSPRLGWVLRWIWQRILNRPPFDEDTREVWETRWGLDPPAYLFWSDPLASWQRSVDSAVDSRKHRVGRAQLAVWAFIAAVAASLAIFANERFDDSRFYGWMVGTEEAVGLPASAGRWLLLVLIGVLGASIAGAWRNDESASGLAAVWDILSFWPRWVLPFAPPPYSFRTVEDLSRRVDHLLVEGRHVVLAGHSQGSMIVTSVILRRWKRWQDMPVGLMTYGSPISTLYGRFFPAYFGEQAVAMLASELAAGSGRWHNLYRPTDWIGGPVGRRSVDVCIPDPAATPAETGLEPPGPVPAMAGHAEYERSSVWKEARAAIFERLRAHTDRPNHTGRPTTPNS